MVEEEVIELPPEEEIPVEKNLAGTTTLFERGKVEDAYVLVNDAGNNRVYLMEKEESEILFEWDLPSGIGNDAVLLEDGNLLVALMDSDAVYSFGGFGGRVAIIAPDGSLLWDFKYSDEVNLAHHDIEMLPNGNILILAWEKKEAEELEQKGYNGPFESVYAEKIMEINPENNEIVWQWNSWDHLVQDQDPTAENFGPVEDSPERINLNFVDPLTKDQLMSGSYDGDIFHANGLDYDEANDLIFLSVNFFSEVWVIDHSTTTGEARSSEGGNYNKGGDLLYRFGNPAAYNNPQGKRMFYHNHHPNVVPGENSLLVFSNGIPSVDAHSTVYELELPEKFDLQSNTDNELQVVWSFAHEELFSAKVSGARRLPNGNTLITEGSAGFWEVTGSGEIVWRFEGDGFFWRGYHYAKDDVSLGPLGL